MRPPKCTIEARRDLAGDRIGHLRRPPRRARRARRRARARAARARPRAAGPALPGAARRARRWCCTAPPRSSTPPRRWLPLQRRLTAPAGRRYLVGWAAERELHVLAPRLLAQRASNVEGSLELLMLAPAALLARRYVAANHPRHAAAVRPAQLRPLAALGVAARGRGAVLLRPGRPRAARGHAAAARGRAAGLPARAARRGAARRHACSTCWRARRASPPCVALACGPHRDGPRAAR